MEYKTTNSEKQADHHVDNIKHIQSEQKIKIYMTYGVKCNNKIISLQSQKNLTCIERSAKLTKTIHQEFDNVV